MSPSISWTHPGGRDCLHPQAGSLLLVLGPVQPCWILPLGALKMHRTDPGSLLRLPGSTFRATLGQKRPTWSMPGPHPLRRAHRERKFLQLSAQEEINCSSMLTGWDNRQPGRRERNKERGPELNKVRAHKIQSPVSQLSQEESWLLCL